MAKRKGGVGGVIIDGKGSPGESGQPADVEDLPSPIPDWLELGAAVKCAMSEPDPFPYSGRVRHHGNWSVLVKPDDERFPLRWCDPRHLRPSRVELSEASSGGEEPG